MPDLVPTPVVIISYAEQEALRGCAAVSRHKSTDLLAGHVRRVDLFKDHAGAAFL
jgi:hypothetical protein